MISGGENRVHLKDFHHDDDGLDEDYEDDDQNIQLVPHLNKDSQ